MSAFIVSKATIDYIVAAAIKFGPVHYPAAACELEIKIKNADAVGTLLWGENVLSFTYRYEGRHQEDTTEARGRYLFDVPAHVDPIIAIKQIHCYAYQSCEHDGWETSAAKKFCDRLEAVLTRAAGARAGAGSDVRHTKTYDDAPWGIDEIEYVPAGAVAMLKPGCQPSAALQAAWGDVKASLRRIAPVPASEIELLPGCAADHCLRCGSTDMTTMGDAICCRACDMGPVIKRAVRTVTPPISHFPSGARVYVDNRDLAIVREAFPEGSTSYAFPHYRIDFVDGDKSVAVKMSRVSVKGPADENAPF